jgi:hypothetical protein
MASQKTPVIEHLFTDPTRWEGGVIGGVMIRSIVTLEETNQAIAQVNATEKLDKPLSTRNPSAFFKDFGRRQESFSKNWPSSLLAAGYTGQQRKGGGAAFEFLKLPPNQTTLFATAAKYPRSPLTTRLQAVQTLSIPLLAKALGRKDENWLQNLAVSLHIPHTHLALHPDPSLQLVEMGHMQSNMKLRTAEIDGLYLGVLSDRSISLITMEAKSDGDDISEPQVIGQIRAIRSLKGVKTYLKEIGAVESDVQIIPMAMKLVPAACTDEVPGAEAFHVTGSRLLYLVDYGAIPFKGDDDSSISLKPRGETLFDLRPKIKGINA